MFISDQLSYNCLKLFHRSINSLSYSKRTRLGQKLGSLVFEKFKIRQKEAKKNIQLAFPKAPKSFHKRILKKLHYHFGIMLLDALCGQKVSEREGMIIEGKNKLNAAY